MPEVETAPAVVTPTTINPMDIKSMFPQSPTPAPAAPVDTPVIEHPAVAQAETPAVETPIPAPVAQPTETPEDAKWNKALNPETPLELDEATEKAIAKYFGTESAAQAKERFQQTQSEIDIYKKEVEAGASLKSLFSKLSPAAQRLVQMEANGEDGIAYVRTLPDSVFRNQEAKNLTSDQLVNTYEPGKVTPQEWQALKDGNFEDLNISKETLEYKVNTLRQMAEVKHEAQRQGIQKELETADAAQKATIENYTKGMATAVSTAKSSPLAPLITDEHIAKYTSGNLVNSLYLQQDGTPSPDSLTNAMKVLLYDEYGARKEAIGYKAGREAGILEATSKLPSGPSKGGRDTTEAPAATDDKKSAHAKWLEKIQAQA